MNAAHPGFTRRQLVQGALLLDCANWASGSERRLQIDSAFPGGNIVVDSIDGDTVSLHQDLRDTVGDWFYWQFRVSGAAGRKLTFRFTAGNVVGVRGPAVSLDGGATWAWLGADSGTRSSFSYAFPSDASDVRFCVAIPYLEAYLRRFLVHHRRSRFLRAGTLCRTLKGRSVELLELGALNGKERPMVLLTARHHACESIASYVLEGLMNAILDSGEPGDWLRENVHFVAIPFMDKDGVEQGDQGKNRRPRDHNRDYDGISIHPSVAALRTLAESWPAGRLQIALDLHCPGLRGAEHEEIHFVGGPDKDSWIYIEQLSRVLESIQEGPLPFRSRNNLPFGKSWNTAANTTAGKSFSRWASELPGIRAAGTLEIPYANAGGAVVNAVTATALGRDLARSFRRVLATNWRRGEAQSAGGACRTIENVRGISTG